VRTREPRTFFLAVTYLMIAAPFSVHGLMTPNHARAEPPGCEHPANITTVPHEVNCGFNFCVP
jgi:hypothetical protein